GISVWDLRARQEIDRFATGNGSQRFAFSLVSPLLAFYVADRADRPGPSAPGGHVRFWDVNERRIVGEIPVSGSCAPLAFSEDGAKLLTVAGDREFTVWSVPQGARLASVTLPPPGRGEVRSPLGTCTMVTRDLNLAAQAMGDGRIRVLDLASGRELWSAQAAEETVTALAFSPDGKWLASGAGYVESTVRLWDAASGRELARLEGHRPYVRSLAFWPDGATLASGSGDQTIHLWDVGGLDFLATTAVQPAPAAAKAEHQVPLRPPALRLPELHPYGTLRGHRLEVWSVALGPDNTTLVSGSKDGAVLVWDTATVRRNPTHVTLPEPSRWCGPYRWLPLRRQRRQWRWLSRLPGLEDRGRPLE
ncbi:MAG: hypothetical protein KDM81_14120, partial [Verrucomicrobiae bacterium]|nr:hypothetical protein [Verrucomicrobiae bacterium]